MNILYCRDACLVASLVITFLGNKSAKSFGKGMLNQESSHKEMEEACRSKQFAKVRTVLISMKCMCSDVLRRYVLHKLQLNIFCTGESLSTSLLDGSQDRLSGITTVCFQQIQIVTRQFDFR